MKKISLIFLAGLFMASTANADLFTLPINTTWTSTQPLTSFAFDIPPNADGTVGDVTIKSITVGIEHTWAGDINLSLTNGANVFNLRTGQGGNFDLGTAAGNAGVPAPYTFVAAGGVAPPGWAPLGGGLVTANTWIFDALPKQGWRFDFSDNVGGDGGTISNVTIEFNKSNVIPEPTSAFALLGLSTFFLGRRRR